ncbi:MAG TPA: A24 family peptidase [Lacipirellulaceae bacterium]|nr:A24 family peptidase [Lacipirellulaceae bacterium]
MTTKVLWLIALLAPLVVGPLWCFGWHQTIGWFGTLAGFVLLTTLIASAITDIKYQRIYNWTTYSAFVWALAINVAATSGARTEDSTLPSLEPASTIGSPLLGGIGIGECLAGAGLCFLVTLFGYDLSGGGAGDVKLATVIGAFLGLHAGVFAVGYSYIVAGIAIIAWTTWKYGPLALAKAGFRKVGRLFGHFWPFPQTAEDQKILMTPVPLGPYFAIGTILVVLELVPT